MIFIVREGCYIWRVTVSNTRKFHFMFIFLSDTQTEPVHEISNNVVCRSIKASDQPAHTRSLIRAFASRLSIL